MFFWKRIKVTEILFSVGIGVIISVLQIIQSITPMLLNDNVFHDSAYTMWLSINPFSFTSILFFILLPLLAAVPASSTLRQDINTGFFNQVKLRHNIRKVLWGYGKTAFIIGFLVIACPLVINFIAWLMILPNVKPDNLLNSNILVFDHNTLLVSLFYEHPLIHSLISIIFASLWGGLFALFAMATSFWIKNTFLVMTSGLLLQIFLLIMNMVFALPGLGSFVPADFLKQTATNNISLVLSGIITLFMILIILIMFKIGKERQIVW